MKKFKMIRQPVALCHFTKLTKEQMKNNTNVMDNHLHAPIEVHPNDHSELQKCTLTQPMDNALI
jgi:hypothetical protein